MNIFYVSALSMELYMVSTENCMLCIVQLSAVSNTGKMKEFSRFIISFS